ncbi:carbonic anhydrase 2-like [Rhopilema esculentum]|uniref:carbonic anhydrase 2-like n=1 Tax=Rhopilema esculentum TaxID=499914 RepID=UPI0031D0FE6B
MSLEVFFVLFASVCQVQQATSWGYSGSEGPANWYKSYPTCNKRRQSPIHLLESEANYKSFSPFQFTGYGLTSSSNFQLENNGHTLQMSLKNWNGMSVRAFGKIFRPWQIHFHWGATDSVGSEHSMKYQNSHLHPGEMHFVHVNTAYDNVSVALTKYDGLMVFGTVMEIDPNGKNNSFISKLTPFLSNITLGKTKVEIQPFPLNDAFMVPNNTFYHYNGSLTTPPCSEAVQWVVFTKEITISHAQMTDFRKLLHHKTMKPANETEYLSNNYRPIQQRNGRTIYRSFKQSPSSAVSIQLSFCALMVILASFLYLKME